MELHIQSEFDCIYSINGEFCERADSLKMSEYDIVYITVFPLKTSLLPYTVKLNGAENIKSDLAYGTRLSSDHYLLLLSPRYMTVYGNTQKTPPPVKPIARLYTAVKSGDIDGAYAMLSSELRASIDKSTLYDFFAASERIADCPWENGNNFYLIDGNGNAKLCAYTLKDEFIDDIQECD